MLLCMGLFFAILGPACGALIQLHDLAVHHANTRRSMRPANSMLLGRDQSRHPVARTNCISRLKHVSAVCVVVDCRSARPQQDPAAHLAYARAIVHPLPARRPTVPRPVGMLFGGDRIGPGFRWPADGSPRASARGSYAAS